MARNFFRSIGFGSRDDKNMMPLENGEMWLNAQTVSGTNGSVLADINEQVISGTSSQMIPGTQAARSNVQDQFITGISASMITGSNSQMIEGANNQMMPGAQSQIPGSTGQMIPGVHTHTTNDTKAHMMPGADSQMLSGTNAPMIPGTHSQLAVATEQMMLGSNTQTMDSANNHTMPGPESQMIAGDHVQMMPGTQSQMPGSTGHTNAHTMTGTNAHIMNGAGSQMMPGTNARMMPGAQSQISRSSEQMMPRSNAQTMAIGNTNMTPESQLMSGINVQMMPGTQTKMPGSNGQMISGTNTHAIAGTNGHMMPGADSQTMPRANAQMMPGAHSRLAGTAGQIMPRLNAHTMASTNNHMMPAPDSQMMTGTNVQMMPGIRSQMPGSNGQIIPGTNTHTMAGTNTLMMPEGDAQMMQGTNDEMMPVVHSQIAKPSEKMNLLTNTQPIVGTNVHMMPGSESQMISRANVQMMPETQSHMTGSNGQMIPETCTQIMPDSNAPRQDTEMNSGTNVQMMSEQLQMNGPATQLIPGKDSHTIHEVGLHPDTKKLLIHGPSGQGMSESNERMILGTAEHNLNEQTTHTPFGQIFSVNGKDPQMMSGASGHIPEEANIHKKIPSDLQMVPEVSKPMISKVNEPTLNQETNIHGQIVTPNIQESSKQIKQRETSYSQTTSCLSTLTTDTAAGDQPFSYLQAQILNKQHLQTNSHPNIEAGDSQYPQAQLTQETQIPINSTVTVHGDSNIQTVLGTLNQTTEPMDLQTLSTALVDSFQATNQTQAEPLEELRKLQMQRVRPTQGEFSNWWESGVPNTTTQNNQPSVPKYTQSTSQTGIPNQSLEREKLLSAFTPFSAKSKTSQIIGIGCRLLWILYLLIAGLFLLIAGFQQIARDNNYTGVTMVLVGSK
ncbi:hypothetical protein SK128_009771 [Halocaridina rubra]|uniref:Uncharacterized protein n=1 Tax=Halocaridina rubra TaxID=373956 RepID=A0AAN8X598_HALRR